MKCRLIDFLILALQLGGALLICYAMAQISPVAATALGGCFSIWLGSVLYRAAHDDDKEGNAQ